MAAASRAHATALHRLAAADATLAPAPWRTLAPDRVHARSLADLGRAVLGDDDPPELAEALAEGLASIAMAMHRSFPDNVFGDLDALAAALLTEARARGVDAADHLRRHAKRVTALQHLFGRGTEIRFRYVHDFVYGFDWAKWVAREPATRSTVGPFAGPFLDFMWQRGHELLTLIADGRDRKYPPLLDGAPRNPFGFSREPAAEIELHRHLAAEGLLPVAAWSIQGHALWDRPYQQLRRQAAARLGLADAPDGGAEPEPVAR